jgi:hypothetical protein
MSNTDGYQRSTTLGAEFEGACLRENDEPEGKEALAIESGWS